MDSFATAAQVAARSGGAIPEDRAFLADELAAASRRIRNHCGWHIWPVAAFTNVRVETHHGADVWLPSLAVVSIQKIVTGGEEVELSGVEFDTDGLLRHRAWHGDTYVDFTHGFAEVPEDLVSLCIELASGGLMSRGVIREQTLASSITWARASSALTSADHVALDAYKLGRLP